VVTDASRVDSLVTVIDRGTSKLADAIKTACNALPDGLFEAVDTLSGFELEHKSMYFEHLVAHPSIARAYINLPFEYKLSWITRFVAERFYYYT
jgi:hypothetical protein